MPFERTGADIDEILEGLKLFPVLTKQVERRFIQRFFNGEIHQNLFIESINKHSQQ